MMDKTQTKAMEEEQRKVTEEWKKVEEQRQVTEEERKKITKEWEKLEVRKKELNQQARVLVEWKKEIEGKAAIAANCSQGARTPENVIEEGPWQVLLLEQPSPESSPGEVGDTAKRQRPRKKRERNEKLLAIFTAQKEAKRERANKTG